MTTTTTATTATGIPRHNEPHSPSQLRSPTTTTTTIPHQNKPLPLNTFCTITFSIFILITIW
ncbi:hypothetical protein E2C01_085769 [Portunus trituberculatus]|uniref:Uncharacterized protein n=1 Tax=Portunus trituberculatus TaxID=210409 RepID=A0A5B7J1W5_PORTR|nr:hypothetical protein [Portunus trituberculatus]